MDSIVAATELIVGDDYLVALLSDEVQVWFVGRNVNMTLIFAVLDEDNGGDVTYTKLRCEVVVIVYIAFGKRQLNEQN